MLAFNEIKKHYSDQEKRLPQLILKEYLQYKILDIIFSSPYGSKLIFMGGTAIRLVYGSDRFSEDLDLDNDSLTEIDFVDLTRYIAKELEREGLEIEFRNTFKNVYHCYLKFPKILFDNDLSPLKEEKIMIRLDSFRTERVADPVSHILSKADIFTEIRTYSREVVLAQKIDALCNRKRAKGRDIYDIIYLLSFTVPDYRYLDRVLNISNKKDLIEKMQSLFSEDKLVELSKDVRPFVMDVKKVIQVKKFNQWLESV